MQSWIPSFFIFAILISACGTKPEKIPQFKLGATISNSKVEEMANDLEAELWVNNETVSVTTNGHLQFELRIKLKSSRKLLPDKAKDMALNSVYEVRLEAAAEDSFKERKALPDNLAEFSVWKNIDGNFTATIDAAIRRNSKEEQKTKLWFIRIALKLKKGNEFIYSKPAKLIVTEDYP